MLERKRHIHSHAHKHIHGILAHTFPHKTRRALRRHYLYNSHNVQCFKSAFATPLRLLYTFSSCIYEVGSYTMTVCLFRRTLLYSFIACTYTILYVHLLVQLEKCVNYTVRAIRAADLKRICTILHYSNPLYMYGHTAPTDGVITSG